MKTKLTLALAMAIAACSTAHAQNTFPAVGDVGINTLGPATDLQVIGVSRFGGAANYVQLDGSGNLSFNGNGNYKVGGNRYAFQFSGNPNYGLFFNSTSVRYEFRNGAAVPIFYVGADDGNAVFTGGVRVGNSSLANAGNLRWNGSDFQGHNGSTWITFATSSNRWGTSGNSGTSAANNFIGTTDNAGFAIRTNNTERLRVEASGNIGIGITNPGVRLHVFGGTDASLNSGGYIIAGDIASNNIVIDNNEIMARDGASADGSGNLFLNNDGGDVQLGLSLRTNYATGSVRIGNSLGTAPSKTLHIGHTNGIATNGLLLESDYAAGLNWQLYTATTDELWLLNDGFQKGEFNGTSGAYTAISDKKFKKDISSIENVLERVMKLNPRNYHFTKQQTNDRKFIGMIAQEVQPLFPEVVYEHSGKNDGTEDFLTLDYSAFGIIAIKAIQEQQEKINSQDKKIEELTKLVNQLLQNSAVSSNSITNNKTVASGASLEQNAPNPFSSSTTIRFSIPASVKNAQIMVTNAAGNTVKTFNLSGKGAGNVTINANELSAGSYFYTLLIDGKKADNKKMVLVK